VDGFTHVVAYHDLLLLGQEIGAISVRIIQIRKTTSCLRRFRRAGGRPDSFGSSLRPQTGASGVMRFLYLGGSNATDPKDRARKVIHRGADEVGHKTP